MNTIEIKEARKKLKLTQTEFGKLLGVSISAVQMWESGKRNISNTALKLLVDILKSKDNAATKHEEVYLEKEGVRFSEIEVVDWLVKNYQHLLQNNNYLNLLIDNEVNNRIKSQLEEKGFKVIENKDK